MEENKCRGGGGRRHHDNQQEVCLRLCLSVSHRFPLCPLPVFVSSVLKQGFYFPSEVKAADGSCLSDRFPPETDGEREGWLIWLADEAP